MVAVSRSADIAQIEEPSSTRADDIPSPETIPVERAPRLIAEPISPETVEVEKYSDETQTSEPVAQEPPDIGTRMWRRFLGTDVEDPLEWARLGTITLGTVGGGLAGSQVPGPPFIKGGAALIGGGLGAVAGALAPEMTLEAGESVGILDPGTRERLGLSPDQLRTVAEGEGLLDLATGGGFTVLRMGGRLGARILTGTGREEMELAEIGAKHGIEMMPVQVGNRRIGRMFVSVMGRFPWIGSKIVERGQVAENELRTALRDAPRRVGPLRSMTSISDLIFRDAEGTVAAMDRYFSARYGSLWTRADELGVAVVPRLTLAKSDEILKKISAQTPAFIEGGEGTAGVALEKVRQFVSNEVLPMRAATETGTALRRQTFRQMDGLVEKIDQELASLEPGQRKWAMELMIQLRQAAQADVVTNARGINAKVVADEMKALDGEFSTTMASLFETATAKRFGSVQRRGLRGVAVDEATRTNIDQLARTVIKLDSPEAMEELARIVTPDTYKAMTARVISDAYTDAISRTADNAVQFDAGLFAKRLGLESFGEIPEVGRREAVQKMLEKSGSPITIQHLDELNRVAQQMASLEIPNVSAFVARRATLGGLRSVISAAIPGIALAGAGTYTVGPVVSIAMMVGGGKLLSAMVSNPLSARALSKVFDKEASKIVRRQASIDALRGGIASLQEMAEIKMPEASQMNWILNEAIHWYDKQLELVRP